MTAYLKAWQKLQQEYFAKVPGNFKYEEWSKFSLETLSHGVRQITLHQKSPAILKNDQFTLQSDGMDPNEMKNLLSHSGYADEYGTSKSFAGQNLTNNQSEDNS